MTWNLFKKSRAPSKARKGPSQRSRYRPGLEYLEDRTLLAAQLVTFVVDPASSALSLSGTLTFAGQTVPLQAQQTGSLTRPFTGTIAASFDEAARTLQFLSAGTSLDATPFPSALQPAVGGGGGSAPADFGGRFTVSIPPFFSVTALVAVRNLMASISNAAPVALTVTDPPPAPVAYSFPSTQTLTLTSGTADFNAGSFGSGTSSIANQSAVNAAGNGSLVDMGNGQFRLTAPINVTINQSISGNPVVLRIQGNMVGNAVLPVVDLNGAASGSDFSTSANGGGPATALTDPGATVTRTPAANLTSATIVLTSRPDGANESLAVNLAGTGLTTPGYNSATGTLVINGNASPTVYQTALRRVTYSNSLTAPTLGNRSVTFVVTDGTNPSILRTTTVNVLPGSQAPLALVQSVVINDGAMQRSLVTSITVTFSTEVNLPMIPANAFSVVGPSGSVQLQVASTVDAMGRTVARITFTGSGILNGSLANGNYTLTILGNNILDRFGRGVDADGDGMAGGNRTVDFHRRFGDLNGDGVTTAVLMYNFSAFPSLTYGGEFGAIVSAAGLQPAGGAPSYVPELDFNGDGVINFVDLGAFVIDEFETVFAS